MEDKNTIHVGTTNYPEGYFDYENDEDDDDDNEMEPLTIGELFDGNLNEEKL